MADYKRRIKLNKWPTAPRTQAFTNTALSIITGPNL
jgi:hypothetical protein